VVGANWTGEEVTLSREQIEQMPAGAELDQLVSRFVMDIPGRPVRVAGTAHNFVVVFSNNPFWSDGSHDAARLRRDAQAKPYSSDISAAWEVVERMLDEWGVWINLENSGCDAPLWAAKFSGPFERAEAPTAPLAICRAALLAVIQ
jgi:hypothetical protein